MARTFLEQAIDRFLLLSLVSFLDEPIVDTALQKFVFLSERELLAKKIEGFHYVFVKLRFGPYSQELERDKDALVFREFLEDLDERGWILSDKGKIVLEKFKPLLEKNAEVLSIIKRIVSSHAGTRLRDLLRQVYELRRPLKGEKVTIRELAERTVLLKPYAFDRPFKISEEEGLRLRIYFDPDVEEVLERSVLGREVLLVSYRGESGYSAFVPSLPGCVTQGESEEEALKNAEEAITLYLETVAAT